MGTRCSSAIEHQPEYGSSGMVHIYDDSQHSSLVEVCRELSQAEADVTRQQYRVMRIKNQEATLAWIEDENSRCCKRLNCIRAIPRRYYMGHRSFLLNEKTSERLRKGFLLRIVEEFEGRKVIKYDGILYVVCS